MRNVVQETCKCGSKFIVNRKYMLCDECNYLRLHGETRLEANLRKKKAEPITFPTNKKKVRKRASKVATKSKRQLQLEADKQTYLEVFNSRPHICEECGFPLPEEFEIDGHILAISQYSHILSKAAFPEFRNSPKNFNRLCLEHHTQWEFGDRKSMNIYNNNQLIVAQLLKEKNS